MDVQDLIDKAGGEPQFQTMCGVARTTVLDWKRTGFIPASRVARISASLDVPLEEVIKLVAEPRERSAPAQVSEVT